MKFIMLINVQMQTTVCFLKIKIMINTTSEHLKARKVLIFKHFRFYENLKVDRTWYGKLTWESAHAWNLIILCLLIVWGMTFIFMVHLSFYAVPLLIYDVMYDSTTIP